ncbi:MAG: helix-turn-helix domain-containing protein [Pirellulales bacterium]
MPTKLTEYVQTAEAAEILGVAQNTLRKWAKRGEIPMHRNPVNGYRLFRRADLETFLHNIERPVNATEKKLEARQRGVKAKHSS